MFLKYCPMGARRVPMKTNGYWLALILLSFSCVDPARQLAGTPCIESVDVETVMVDGIDRPQGSLFVDRYLLVSNLAYCSPV